MMGITIGHQIAVSPSRTPSPPFRVGRAVPVREHTPDLYAGQSRRALLSASDRSALGSAFPRMSGTVAIPSYKELLWPTVRAVREIGDSGTIEEIVEKVIDLEGFTEEQQAVPHGDGPASEIEYRLAWARTYLKGMGALDNSKRGVWSTTESGRSMTQSDVLPRHAELRRKVARGEKGQEGREGFRRGRSRKRWRGRNRDGDWKEQLIEELLATPPDRFERLARRLLREAGFISATVTGKSGDGGIDGIGVYRRTLDGRTRPYQFSRPAN
jgi:restriction system protein